MMSVEYSGSGGKHVRKIRRPTIEMKVLVSVLWASTDECRVYGSGHTHDGLPEQAHASEADAHRVKPGEELLAEESEGDDEAQASSGPGHQGYVRRQDLRHPPPTCVW
jgi:hypothetical protein